MKPAELFDGGVVKRIKLDVNEDEGSMLKLDAEKRRRKIVKKSLDFDRQHH